MKNHLSQLTLLTIFLFAFGTNYYETVPRDALEKIYYHWRD